MALDNTSKLDDIYQDELGALYRVIGFQPNPTVIVERTTDNKRSTHAIGCRNAEMFTRIGTLARPMNADNAPRGDEEIEP